VRTLPIRLRLALAFAAVAALLLTAVGLFGYLRLAAGFSDDLDRELRQHAQDLAGPVTDAHISLRQLSGSGFIERGESFAELVTPSGHVVDSTPTLHGQALLTPEQAADGAGQTLTLNRPNAPGLDEPARLLATPVHRQGRQLVLVVGITRENGLEALRRVRGQLLVAIPLLTLLAFAGAYAVAGAALRPVELMRRRATELTGEDPALRLPVPERDDEISRLGRTLNQLLARVEETLERERSFVASASHELRTPLALLRTELELALRHPREAPELRASVRSAAAEVDRLERLAEDLLLLAQSGDAGLAVHTETVDLEELLGSVVARFAPALREAGRRLAAEPTDAVVRGDRRLLQQALTNLVANAWEHGQGPVCLRIGVMRSEVQIVVADAGPGLDEAVEGRESERFVRRRGSSGAGLGLAIVAAVADAHGGSSGFRRTEEGGEAWIALPAVAGARPSP
jgi:two-component system, OmpR family, sensor kinase